MAMKKPLFKTTVIIWTDYDTGARELDDLARDATQGDAYCSKQHGEWVADPAADDAAPSEEFFWDDEGECATCGRSLDDHGCCPEVEAERKCFPEEQEED